MADSDQDTSEGILVRAVRMAEQTESKRFVPRNPRTIHKKDDLSDFKKFLREEQPLTLAVSEPERSLYPRKAVESSSTESHRAKQPLDFFRTGRFHSKHLKGLLRSRSVSPPPPASQQQTLENAYVVQKISLFRQRTLDKQAEYTRILRDSSQTDSLDKLSTYRVNYAIDGAGPKETPGIGSKITGPRSFGLRQEQSQADNVLNSKRQGRLLSEVSNQQIKVEANKYIANGYPQQNSIKQLRGSGSRSHSVPRQGAPPQIRDFAEEGPQFPDPELIETIQHKKGRALRKMIPEDWEVERGESTTADKEAILKSADAGKPLLMSHVDNNDQATRKRRSRHGVRTSLALSAETQSADVRSVGRHSKESTGHSISASDNNDTATDITVPSVNGNHIETNRFRGTASPKPAPTGPLPPLPEGADPSYACKSFVPQAVQQERLQLPAALLSPIPPKSPARNRQPLSAHPTHFSNDNARPKLESDLEWPYPPLGQDSVRSTPKSKVSSCLQGNNESGDPFTSRINKTVCIKRRDLQHSGHNFGKSLADIGKTGTGKFRGDMYATDLVSMPQETQRLTEPMPFFKPDKDPEHDQKDIACGSPKGQHGLEFSKIQTTVETAPVTIEPQSKSYPSNTRITYRSRGTQCSSDHGTDDSSASGRVTMPRGPSLVLTEPDVDSIQEINGGASNTARQISRRQSASDSRISSDSRYSGMRANTPDHFADMNDLESRMEARLASFEQKTMLLEAALLGVINASSRNGSGIGRGNRASVGSRNGSRVLWETALDGLAANTESKEPNDRVI